MKIPPEQKSTKMAAIGLNYAVIRKAEEEVHGLKVAAAPEIDEVVKSFGPGPHKMPVPGADGSSKDYIVNFRKDGKTYTASAVSVDSIS